MGVGHSFLEIRWIALKFSSLQSTPTETFRKKAREGARAAPRSDQELCVECGVCAHALLRNAGMDSDLELKIQKHSHIQMAGALLVLPPPTVYLEVSRASLARFCLKTLELSGGRFPVKCSLRFLRPATLWSPGCLGAHRDPPTLPIPTKFWLQVCTTTPGSPRRIFILSMLASSFWLVLFILLHSRAY